MKRIIYSSHLNLRLRLRGLDANLPLLIYQEADENYFDNATNLNIAIREITNRPSKRVFAVTYKESDDEVLLITIHPLKSNQKENRIKSRRWIKI